MFARPTQIFGYIANALAIIGADKRLILANPIVQKHHRHGVGQTGQQLGVGIKSERRHQHAGNFQRH